MKQYESMDSRNKSTATGTQFPDTIHAILVSDFPTSFQNFPPVKDEALLALNIIEIFLALITAIVAITSSAYSCRAVCCRKTKSQGTVFYNPAGLQGLPVLCQSVPLLAGSVDASQNAHTQVDESVVDAEAGHYQRLL
jgi:hypothetical protein